MAYWSNRTCPSNGSSNASVGKSWPSRRYGRWPESATLRRARVLVHTGRNGGSPLPYPRQLPAFECPGPVAFKVPLFDENLIVVQLRFYILRALNQVCSRESWSPELKSLCGCQEPVHRQDGVARQRSGMAGIFLEFQPDAVFDDRYLS